MTKVVVWFLCFLPCVLSQSDGDIRLVRPNITAGGSNYTFEGRVEIYHNNQWGTICDDRWGKEESKVVCHQLGYPLGAQYWYSNAYFGPGKDPIWMDDVTCVGNETALTACKHNGWGGHNCHHFEDVSVVCRQEVSYSTPGTCDFEKGHGMCSYKNLVAKDSFNWTFGGRNVRYGRWPKTDHTTANTTGKGFYATTFIRFWEDITQGNMARLQSPTISSATCVEFYYFMGGSTVGELIVYFKSASQEEKVVWQLLGDQGFVWNKGVIPIDSSKYKNFNIIFEGVAGTGYYGSDVALDDISVTNAASCSFSPAVANPTIQVPSNGTIRLMPRHGSDVLSAGRVEVFHGLGSKGRWGTVCNGYSRSFDIKAATVVCKELGYEGAEMVVPCCEAFGKGTGRIWLDRVKCLGTEPSITMCPNSGWGNTFCSHDQDVSVVCKTKQTDRTEFDVRLGNDSGVNFKGRVEVKIGGLWGTVTDHGWDIYDANVVCKQLGLGGAVGAYSGSRFGNGKGPIWMSDFQCNGTEVKLANCNHSNTDVQSRWGHYQDASVECFDLRLANGGSKMSGRVEVMFEGYWGTVCNHNWDINAGNVVCRQLGYRRADAVGQFGKGLGQIFLDQVQCKGNEPSLSFCRHLGWTAHHCTHDNDAGVVCTNAVCSASMPCLNGGSCNTSSGYCNCKVYFVGDTCQLSVENKTVRVEFGGKLQQWNKTSFVHQVVQDLNMYCSKVNCSTALSKGQKNHDLIFEDSNIQVIEAAKQKDKGVLVGFVVLYSDGMNTQVMPRSFVHDFISSKGDKLAGYNVVMVDGKDEGSPAGRHSNSSHKSNNKYIYIGVGVTLGLIALLALVFVVKRYGKRLVRDGGGSSALPSHLSDQSYLALHAEDYDESDDTALLRPPQQPGDEGDLLS